MLEISASQIDRLATYPELVETLREAFRSRINAPVRHHHTVARPDGAASTLLLMPAWSDFTALPGGSGHGFMGVKIVTVSPDNAALGKPSVMGLYLLLHGKTGEPVALIDGPRLTVRRTAAASALAAGYLARKDAETLLLIGSGALAPELAKAHAAVRPIRRVLVWNRSIAGAERAATDLRSQGLDAFVADNLDHALPQADIVSAATLSAVPLVKGALLKPGAHVDLVGAFSPSMRESDDETMRRGRVYVDTRGGALKEGGDIVQAIASGALAESDIAGDLHDLARGDVAGRADGAEITVFKSVGAALEDLAAAVEIYKRATA
jgi:ornithine cyclodeaminase